MKPIRVNADYEISLFEGKEAPQIINHSLEFLALFLEERPLASTRKYSDEYLSYIEKVTGRKPSVVSTNDAENWWGSLKEKALESKLNSKVFSAALSEECQVIDSPDQMNLEDGKKYLGKNPFGMSGQNIIVFDKNHLSEIELALKKTGKIIVEPFYDRYKDFSHYVFPDGKSICYENIVDNRFQYKGTIFRDLTSPSLESLKFYNEVDAEEWKKFQASFIRISQAMISEGATSGYSIDSFCYKENNKIHVRALCEINYRKTMGLMAWMLAQKFASDKKWAMLILGKSLKSGKRITEISECLHLSPGDTRFEMFFLFADSEEEGLLTFNRLKTLLPDCQFTI